MSAPLDLVPNTADTVDQNRKVSPEWYRWFYDLWNRIRIAVQLAKHVTLTNQSAAIVTTTAYTVTQTGVYRVSTYLRVTTAATVSSSATVTLTWIDDVTTVSHAFTAATGNTTTTTDHTSILVRATSGTDLKYAVAYASVGATAMVYKIDLTVEWVD